MFCHEVFFRMTLHLDLDIFNWLFIDSLGFMAVDRIKKHLHTFWESDSLSITFPPRGVLVSCTFMENMEVFLLYYPLVFTQA